MIAVDDQRLQRAVMDALARGCKAGRLRLDDLLAHVFYEAARYERSHRRLRFAYSVKTNPRREILHAARRAGFFAEVISPHELRHVRKSGFDADSIIYNGPYPAAVADDEAGVIFADSIEAYSAACARFPDALVGVRLRSDGVRSRFGIAAPLLKEAAQVIRSARREALGVSFHVRPQDYPTGGWRAVAEWAAAAAQQLQAAAATPVVVFDVGGGKRPHELDDAIAAGDFAWLESCICSSLTQVRTIVCEPGQALVQSLEAVVAPVLEVRRSQHSCEVVVDGGYPDLPQIATFAHRIFHWSDGTLSPVSAFGPTRILGRTCLEYDVIADTADLQHCTVGDAIVICYAGAYDSSMAFTFAHGEHGNRATHGLAAR